MAARKQKPAEPVVETNALGKRIVDGAPYFRTHNGIPMNRKQWLAATADARHAAVKAELEAHAQEG